MIEVQIVKDKFTDHSISYYVENNDIYLCNINIDWDDLKTFIAMLTRFCDKASDDKIKYIKHLVSDDEYKFNKHLFREFEVLNNNNGSCDLIAEPSKFTNAMLTGFGFYDVEDKTDKKI